MGLPFARFRVVITTCSLSFAMGNATAEIQAYANAQGYDLVLGDGVFFAKGPLDITAQVLAVLATKPATLPATPAAPAAAPKPAQPK